MNDVTAEYDTQRIFWRNNWQSSGYEPSARSAKLTRQNFPVNQYEILGVVSAVTCLAVIGLCGCYISRRRRRSMKSGYEDFGRRGPSRLDTASPMTSVVDSLSPDAAQQCAHQDLCISQSTPDFIGTADGRESEDLMFTREPSSSAGGRCKHTFIKQRTLPVVSSRHTWFNRMLFRRSPVSVPRPSLGDDINQCEPQQRQTVTCTNNHSAQPTGARYVTLQTGLVQPAQQYQRHLYRHHHQQQQQQQQGLIPSPRSESVNVPLRNAVHDSQPQPRDNPGNEYLAADAAVTSYVSRVSPRISYGHLHIGLSYIRSSDVVNSNGGLLVVHVIRIDGLPAREFSGTSDPYIKIYMLPDRTVGHQTKLQRKTLNPVFDERFTFHVESLEALQSRLLHFSIYDYDRFSRHEVIGTAVMQPRLHSPDVSTERLHVLDIAGKKQQGTVELGELLLSLRYLPTAGRLTVTILKARNLRAVDISGKSDPFVRVTMMCQGHRITKRKTSVQRSTAFPTYNETMTFDVPYENIDDVSLIFKVMHQDSGSGCESMGACSVGSRFSDAGRSHWLKMLELPRKSVAQWYQLVVHDPPATMSSQL